MTDNKVKEITDFKINTWFLKSSMSVVFGIDGKVDGKWYHLTDNDKPLFYKSESEAKAKMKELRKDERERQGIMTLRKQEPKGRTLNLR